MSQESLFHESLTDALGDLIRACGGTKAVACKMWPEKSPDAAHRLLLACLNESRVERLNPDQVMFLLRLGREHGYHGAMLYITRDCGYTDPAPVEPEDERARLQREYVEAVKGLGHLADRMERLGIGSARK